MNLMSFFLELIKLMLEINASSNVRINTITIVKGTATGSPVPAVLTNAGDLHQYPLAYVRVNSGASQIVQGNITDKVGSSLCPFVTGPLTVINNDTILANWNNEFYAWFNGLQDDHDELLQDLTDDWNAWFATIQDMLDDNQAGHLQNEIDTLSAANNVLLADITGSETEDEFDFDNIPNDYFNLRLVGTLKFLNTGSFKAANANLKLNNDAAAHYLGINTYTEDPKWYNNWSWNSSPSTLRRVVFQADNGRAQNADAVRLQFTNQFERVDALEFGVLAVFAFDAHPHPGDAQAHKLIDGVRAEHLGRTEHVQRP